MHYNAHMVASSDMKNTTFLTIISIVLLSAFSVAHAKTYRYISIPSGGMLGIIPAHLLADIEAQCGNKPIHKLVDGMAGSSTGALISSLLTIPAKDGKAPYSATEVCAFYKERGAPIFNAAKVAAMGALFGAPDYSESSAQLKKHTEEVFGSFKMSDALTNLMILTHDKTNSKKVVFDSRNAKADAAQDLFVSDAARASSSVELAFGSVELQLASGTATFVDAGSLGLRSQVNDPINFLIEKILPTLSDNDRVVIYSLGTGFSNIPALAIKSDKIEVISIQPNVRHMVSFLGMDYLAADSSANTLKGMIAVSEKLKATPNYQRMLADLKGTSANEEL